MPEFERRFRIGTPEVIRIVSILSSAVAPQLPSSTRPSLFPNDRKTRGTSLPNLRGRVARFVSPSPVSSSLPVAARQCPSTQKKRETTHLVLNRAVAPDGGHILRHDDGIGTSCERLGECAFVLVVGRSIDEKLGARSGSSPNCQFQLSEALSSERPRVGY